MSAPIVTVLVVDDRPDVRLSLLYMLEACGYGIAEAADGHQAMAAIAKGQVDVVLADLYMPSMDGVELVRAIRSRPFAQPRIILMTGSYHLEQDISRGALEQIGADAILLKPFNRETLVQTIEHITYRPSDDPQTAKRYASDHIR